MKTYEISKNPGRTVKLQSNREAGIYFIEIVRHTFPSKVISDAQLDKRDLLNLFLAIQEEIMGEIR